MADKTLEDSLITFVFFWRGVSTNAIIASMGQIDGAWIVTG